MFTHHLPPLSPMCVSCLFKKHLDNIPESATREQALDYQRRLGALLAALPDSTFGPEMLANIKAVHAAVFGDDPQEEINRFAVIKRHFNALMMDFAAAEGLPARIRAASDPVREALGYAMIGNFIDFGAMSTVDEDHLRALLAKASAQIPADSVVYAGFLSELTAARRLVFLTDNCGEVVMDKLLIELLHERYPSLHITVLVRGAPVLNDATMEDAAQIGLDALPGVTVMGNGNSLAGTALGRLSPAAESAISAADLILAKGQGNYETLQGCDLNIYYAFLCKCTLFASRFSVPLYTGMLVRERGAKRTLNPQKTLNE